MKIPLKAWAAKHFDPPPNDRKLREIARAGKIDPAPVKLGREYWVDTMPSSWPSRSMLSAYRMGLAGGWLIF